MKKIKKSSEMLRADDLPPVIQYLSTGCTILDLAIADRLPGGFPAGRISHIYGKESASKSVLVCEPLGSAQRQGGNAYFVDSEGTLDKNRARDLFGVNIGKLDYLSNMEVEDLTIGYFFDEYLPFVQSDIKGLNAPSAVAIDSLSAIPSGIEISEDIDTKTYGTSRASMLSRGFRKHIWRINKLNLALIFVDQVRQNVGVVFGKQYTFSGGEALKFYATTRVEVSIKKTIKNKHDRVVGVEVNFKVDKNKIAPPYRQGTFYLIFDYGIDDIKTSLQWLKDNTKGSTRYFTPDTKESYQSINQAIFYVEENNQEKWLQDLVYGKWKQIYSNDDNRKKRIR